MCSGQNSYGGGWFMDCGGVDDEVQAADFICPSNIMSDFCMSRAYSLDAPHKEESNCGNVLKKRNRVSSCAGAGAKACREKMRRDKLNDRFVELCNVLDPGRPPKSDKFAILANATCRLNELRSEVQKLKELNESLQVTIKDLKAEKLELRDEKLRLKTEKDQTEQMMKRVSFPSPFLAHPAAGPIYPAAFTTCNKHAPCPNYPPMGMWQWLPPAALDTSRDYVLRPPAA